MGVTILITFSNDTDIFYPGQFIHGKVSLQTDTDITVKGLTLTFFGDAEVYWTESDVRHGITSLYQSSNNRRSLNRQVHREYRNQETFLCEELVLFGQGDEETYDQMNLTPGLREYSFTFQLPLNDLPSSFSDSPFGFIRYTMEARLKRQVFRFDRAEKEFFVRGILDLNFTPSVFEPLGVTKRLDIGWICCPEGYIMADFKLEKTGYLPSDSIMFTVSSLNFSNSVTITHMQATLLQIIEFITFDRKKTVSNVLSTNHFTATNEIGTPNEWIDRIAIPETLPPTSWKGCRILRIYYKIDVLIKFSNKNKMVLSAPIIIGTEPCPIRHYQVQPEISQSSNNFSLVAESFQRKATRNEEYNPALNPFLDEFVEDQKTHIEEQNNNEQCSASQLQCLQEL